MAEGRGRVVCGTFDHEGKMPDSDTHAEFEPQTTQSMVDALVVTFRVLRLSARRPDLAALATRKIIELAGAGEREVERLKRAARDNNSSNFSRSSSPATGMEIANLRTAIMPATSTAT
jgi:hypothetical protein